LNETSVLVGAHSLNASEPSKKRLQLKQTVMHPRFNYSFPLHGNHIYDIALLKLRTPIEFSDEVKPICVDGHEVPSGTSCYVTGWGSTEG